MAVLVLLRGVKKLIKYDNWNLIFGPAFLPFGKQNGERAVFRLLRICAMAAPLSLAAGATFAQGFEFQDSRLIARGVIETSPQITDQSSDDARLDLLVGQSLEVQGRFRWRNSNGDQLIFEPGIRTEFFPAKSELDDLDLSLFGEYRTNLEQFDRTQLRLRFGIDNNIRFPDQRFLRYTAQAAVNVRRDNGRSVTYRLRYRYRNQNEGNSFDGFDQNELLGSVRFAWSFKDQSLEQISLTPFFDLRDADADNFDSTQIGVRAQVRYNLGNGLTLTGRASAFVRNLGGDFSTTFPEERRDERASVQVELRKDLGDRHSVFGAIGYEDNNSNIPVRDYSGGTLRLGFETTF